MPAQMYVMAVIGTVAAAVFFKEFVYEPHIAPNVERWAEQFIAHRQARRRQREVPLVVPARSQNVPRRSISGDSDRRSRSSIELESLVAKEVDEWRSNVIRSQTVLKHRKHMSASALDGSNAPNIPFTTISPTHVIFDPASPTTPTSHGGSASAGGSPAQASTRKLDHTTSSTLHSPDIQSITLPTPDPSLRPLSPGVLNDASIIASYEVAQAPDSPRSNLDLESVSGSPFSSRPQSPFSAFSAVGAPAHQGVLFEAPLSEIDFVSDSENGSFVLHSSAVGGGRQVVFAAPPSDMDYESDSENGSFVLHSASNVSVGGSVDGGDFDSQSSRWDASSTSSWASAVTRSV